MLGLAKRVKAKLLLTSTSEIYGDPEVHPQPESYWGNVNTLGPRSCYDEGKRIAETMCLCYSTQHGVQVRIARIFNTFGPRYVALSPTPTPLALAPPPLGSCTDLDSKGAHPHPLIHPCRMDPNDGRVVSNFIIQALKGIPLTVFGDGSQTRSFQYVSDLVQGLVALMNSPDAMCAVPVNLGNPDEFTIKQFAEFIQGMINKDAPIVHKPATTDDPKQRKPDNRRAAEKLNWCPRMSVKDGIERSILYFRYEIGKARAGIDPEQPQVWLTTPVVDVLDKGYLEGRAAFST
jgi:UDP-glucuronate decarboxylase